MPSSTDIIIIDLHPRPSPTHVKQDACQLRPRALIRPPALPPSTRLQRAQVLFCALAPPVAPVEPVEPVDASDECELMLVVLIGWGGGWGGEREGGRRGEARSAALKKRRNEGDCAAGG